MKKGFTLIELLVVVLIIGILSSVALPQYTKAVKKSRVATLTPILKSMIEAGEAYLLANPVTRGSSLTQLPFDSLDIEIPSTTFDLKEGTCTLELSVPNKNGSEEISLVAFCFGSLGNKGLIILGLTNTGELFCSGQSTNALCKEYGFSKASTLNSSKLGGTVTGSVFTM